MERTIKPRQPCLWELERPYLSAMDSMTSLDSFSPDPVTSR